MNTNFKFIKGFIAGSAITEKASIKVTHEYFYRVDFGPTVKPQYHTVSYNFHCSCYLDDDCPAFFAVKQYLQEGGEKARNPQPGYFPAVPHTCPLCGSKTGYQPNLSSPSRGIGWECQKGGTAHYWRYELACLQAAYEEKWKRLEVDPSAFKSLACFSFKEGYHPEG
jgi:hypothetical protein